MVVEVPAAATIRQVKDHIADLYGIPIEAQKLQLTSDASDECFADQVPAAWASRLGTLHLLQGGNVDELDQGQGMEQKEGYYQELEVFEDARTTAHAVVESLEGVIYQIQVLCRRSNQSLTLEVDAMCSVGEVLLAAVNELLGETAGSEDLALFFSDGRQLPTDLPLHFAGVRDREALLLRPDGAENSTEESDGEDMDPFDDYIQSWAASRSRGC